MFNTPPDSTHFGALGRRPAEAELLCLLLVAARNDRGFAPTPGKFRQFEKEKQVTNP